MALALTGEDVGEALEQADAGAWPLPADRREEPPSAPTAAHSALGHPDPEAAPDRLAAREAKSHRRRTLLPRGSPLDHFEPLADRAQTDREVAAGLVERLIESSRTSSRISPPRAGAGSFAQRLETISKTLG
jgi:hypothetical protein